MFLQTTNDFKIELIEKKQDSLTETNDKAFSICGSTFKGDSGLDLNSKEIQESKQQ